MKHYAPNHKLVDMEDLVPHLFHQVIYSPISISLPNLSLLAVPVFKVSLLQIFDVLRGSYMVWEINMEVCPRLEFDNIMFINCLGYDFYMYGASDFLCNSIANLWRHVWYYYNTLGYPVIIISKVIDIPCNGRRNVLSNNFFIDKFVDTINDVICTRIVGGHSFLWHGTPIFNCIFCIQSNLKLIFLHVVVFVKIPFQHINYP